MSNFMCEYYLMIYKTLITFFIIKQVAYFFLKAKNKMLIELTYFSLIYSQN